MSFFHHDDPKVPEELAKLSKSELLERAVFLTNILDSMDFPISVTNNEMEWTFFNTAAEKFAGTGRQESMGKQCHNWGADICQTERCGIECLRRGITKSFFEQPGMDAYFQVNVFYLKDKTGQTIGHIEVVQDNTSQKNLNNTVAKVKELSNETVSSAEQLHLAVKEANIAIEDVAFAFQEVAQNSQDISESTNTAQEEAKKANDSAGQSKIVTKRVSSLVDKSNEITKIIETISNISGQTNLLALNAAIEAARAGDAGKGFAVVAGEVGKLAEKSKESTELISSLIEGIQTEVKSVESAVKSFEQIYGLVDSVYQALEKIKSISGQNASRTESVASSVQEVSATMQQISETANNLSENSNQLNLSVEGIEVTN